MARSALSRELRLRARKRVLGSARKGLRPTHAASMFERLEDRWLLAGVVMQAGYFQTWD